MSTIPGKSAFIIQGIPRDICLRRLHFKKISRLIHPQNHSFVPSHPINTSLKFSNDRKKPQLCKIHSFISFFFLPSPLPNSLEYDISLSTVHLGS